MECTFQVGDKVVCVVVPTPNPGYAATETFPVAGCTYTVRDVEPFPQGIGIRLVEIVNAPKMYHARSGLTEAAWAYGCFRPVTTTKTDIGIFTEIVRREFDVDKVVKPVKEIA